MAAIVEIATETGAYATAGLHAAAAANRPGAVAVAERITVADDPEAIFERFASEGWTDGLPIVPPTEDRVAQMLAFSEVDPCSSLGPMPPRWGEATIATLAVNAVMAGCKPEYFPLVVTAVKAILSKPFNLYGIQGTTNPASPVLIVNGPIAREIGINGRGNLFGPGFRANATIGRAIRLIMTTIGGGVPQQADKSTLGTSWQTKASCRTLSRTRHEYRETAHISTIAHNMRIAWIDALSRSRSRKTTVGCASMGSTENSEHSTGSRDGDGAPSRH